MCKCAICKEREANQEHHLSYEPDITIDVCRECHSELHIHGVGRGRHEKQKEMKQGIISGKFTRTIVKNNTPYVVDMKEQVLCRLVCPNGCSDWEWGLWETPNGIRYVRCVECGYDAELNEVEIIA